MPVSGIGGNIGGIGSALPDALNTTAQPSGGSAFSELLSALSGTSTEAQDAVSDLAVGGQRDVHDVVLAVEMESLAFDLAVQIRNRLVEAYSEVFRMQV